MRERNEERRGAQALPSGPTKTEALKSTAEPRPAQHKYEREGLHTDASALMCLQLPLIRATTDIFTFLVYPCLRSV